MKPICAFLLLLLLPVHTIASAEVGIVQLPTSGARQAQADFLHGLAQLHNFEYEDAAAAFRRAQDKDSKFAMAYWGEAMTYNHPIWMQQDRDAARAVLARLGDEKAQLAKAKTALEKDFIRAVQVLYGEGEKNARDFLYRDHLARMYENYPGNPEVGALYALSLLGTAHRGRDFTIYMRSAAVTLPLIATHDQHPGLAHYLIHATDDPVHAPLGYRAALTYSKIAPDAAHAQHMTSHIFLALGHWQDTAAANEKAVAVMDRQRAANGLPSMGCGHYPSWQMYAYLQLGRLEDATARMKLCYQRTAQNAADQPSAFDYMKELYLFDSEDWTGEVAGMQVERRGDTADTFSAQYIDAARALNTGADDAEDRAASALAAGTARIAAGLSANGQATITLKMLHLKAWLAARGNDAAEAEKYWREAVSLENDQPYGFGPPSPAKPALEGFGEFLLGQGRYQEAAATFRLALERTVNRARSKQGLALALDKAGNAGPATVSR